MSRDKDEINKYLDDNNDYCPTALKTKGVIYILGPMRGYPNLNFDAFYAAETKLREEGWVVINPAATSPMGLKSPKAYLLVDLMYISEATAVYRLEGWENSKGAVLENAWADFLELEIIDEIKDSNQVEYDAILRDWVIVEKAVYGNIFDDKKKRFPDGYPIKVSYILGIEDPFLYTENTIYKLEDKIGSK